MTIGKKWNIGACVKMARDADGNRVIYATIWYPAGNGRLGYLYPSITF